MGKPSYDSPSAFVLGLSIYKFGFSLKLRERSGLALTFLDQTILKTLCLLIGYLNWLVKKMAGIASPLHSYTLYCGMDSFDFMLGIATFLGPNLST
jgi:hypothetical protein